jgi:hypothetical protein
MSLGWLILIAVVLFLIIPVFVYAVTRCFCDAKHKSKLEFLQHYKSLGGNNGEKDKFNERKS